MRLTFLAGMLLMSLPNSGQQTLISLQDHHRALVVFAPEGQDKQLRTQLALLDGTQMAERDLILVPVLAKWDKRDGDLRAAHAPFTTDTEQVAIRRHFAVQSNDFAVLLVGKDGGEKFRSSTPVTMKRLNQIIDAMPMRQQEMQSHHRY